MNTKTSLQHVLDFHGSTTPGIVIGRYMMEKAKTGFSSDRLFHVIVETSKGLPDAVQILTGCTIGNGGLKLVNLGRYALSLYGRSDGKGIRAYLDPKKLDQYKQIKGWLYKTTPEAAYNMQALIVEIHSAGTGIYSTKPVKMLPRFLKTRPQGKILTCSVCGEAYPQSDGGICRGCTNETPYAETDTILSGDFLQPKLKTIAVEDAVGKRALHDMTKIEPGVFKGPEIKYGQEISAGDICRLQKMGKNSIFIVDEMEDNQDWVHENDAVLSFAENMAGFGVTYDEKPEEGKITFTAEKKGLFVLNRPKLERFNLHKDVMCASRHGYTVVGKDKPIAGSRAIPLFISRQRFERAVESLAGGFPLLQVLPMRQAKVGILVTGTEIFKGLIKDRFIPIVKSKVEKLSCTVIGQIIAPDDKRLITESVNDLIAGGTDLVITTAGMSVDPDDVTRPGLMDAGLTDMVYGTPVLPGTMTLVGRIGTAQVIGVPACALYFNITSFDLLLPRLLAGLDITAKDMAQMGEGGLCQNCRLCTFPKCPFGK
jgi:formylmethanofuran dehydrogenase subunit E